MQIVMSFQETGDPTDLAKYLQGLWASLLTVQVDAWSNPANRSFAVDVVSSSEDGRGILRGILAHCTL